MQLKYHLSLICKACKYVISKIKPFSFQVLWQMYKRYHIYKWGVAFLLLLFNINSISYANELFPPSFSHVYKRDNQARIAKKLCIALWNLLGQLCNKSSPAIVVFAQSLKKITPTWWPHCARKHSNPTSCGHTNPLREACMISLTMFKEMT